MFTKALLPSPAISIVGRHNSGKTTLIEKLIANLTARGLDIGSIKHHSHSGFDIDVPGKDSYRHRAAGATETVIACPDQMAVIKDMSGEVECSTIVQNMPGHDVIIVEGYRKSGIPTIEIMRAANKADEAVARVFLQNALAGESLGSDVVQQARRGADDVFPCEQGAAPDDLVEKMPTSQTIAVVSDIPEAVKAAELYDIPCFDVNDVEALADFVEREYARPKLTVVIQAGGESRRMGQSKALVSFEGRPLIMRLVERVAPAADHIIITTNEAEKLNFIYCNFPDLDIRLVPDKLDYRGALPGLYTALSASTTDNVAVVACDMLFASARLIAAESIEMNATHADAVIPVNKHGFEPFHALYSKSRCLPFIEECLAKGERRAQAFLDKVTVCEYPQAKVMTAEPMGGCFANANTPEELAALGRVVEE